MTHQNPKHLHNRKLTEGLQTGDLKDFVSNLFTVDQYQSKMGQDQDILVLGFNVHEKSPAIDLMEFIEKGYKFVLDADMSPGEERDGHYRVFVELERTPKITSQLTHLLKGISQLCDCYDWNFRYYKNSKTVPFNEETITEHIPMTSTEYESKILEIKNNDLAEFFDQGITNIALESDNTITFSKPYAGDLTAKFISIGDYDNVKNTIPGALNLDESSHSQITFLNKYLGNYDISKIDDKFLIRNGDKAVIIEKNRW